MKTFLILTAALTLPCTMLSEPYLGRCHMCECLHYDQVAREVVGPGSDAVPGELVLVALRSAVSDRPDADPATLVWDTPAPVQIFCAMDRPAYRLGDSSYQGLNLVTSTGATTLVTAMYLHACHPEAKLDNDPFAAAGAIGYGATPLVVHADFATLTRR